MKLVKVIDYRTFADIILDTLPSEGDAMSEYTLWVRTGLKPSTLQEQLSVLVSEGMVECVRGRFFLATPKQSHSDDFSQSSHP